MNVSRSCLLPLIDALGIKESESSVKEYFNNAELIEIGLIFNFFAEFHYKAVLKDHNEFNQEKYPILLVKKNGDTYIVLNRNEDKLLGLDPQTNEIRDLIQIESTDIFVEFDKIPEQEKYLAQSTLNWTFKLIMKFRILFFQIFMVSMILNFLAFGTPVYIMLVFSKVVYSSSDVNLSALTIGAFLLIVSNFLFGSGKSYSLNFFSSRLSFLVSLEFVRRLFIADPRYQSRLNAYDVEKKIDQFQKMANSLGGYLTERLIDIVYMVFMLVFLSFISTDIALVVFSLFCFLVAGGILYTSFTKKYNELFLTDERQVNSMISESVKNRQLIKFSCAVERWMYKVRGIVERKLENDASVQILSNVTTILTNTLISLIVLCCVFVGVLQVINGEISESSLMASIFIVWRAMEPIRGLLFLALNIDNSFRKMQELDEFMNKSLEREESDKGAKFIAISDVSFEGVSLKYRNESRMILRNLKLKLRDQEKTLIVTTDDSIRHNLVNLLLGTVIPTLGSITLNGIELSQYNPSDLRNSFSVAPKMNNLFGLSLYQYLSLSDSIVNEKEFLRILLKLGVELEEDDLYRGFDDLIQKFNEGDIKKINVVRALVRNNLPIILSDISYYLDDRDIVSVKKFLNEFKKDLGMMIITDNSLNFLDVVDRVVVIEGAGVIFNGTKKEFLKQQKGAA